MIWKGVVYMGNTIDKSVLNQYTMTDYSTLFNSLPKTDASSGGGLVNLATEFQSIRSGSYGKLLSAYYQKMENEGREEAIEKENTNRQLVAGNSSSLKSAASKLSDMDFTKATEEESLSAVKDFISSLKTVEKVEILPYHDMGSYKWKKLGFKYDLENDFKQYYEDGKMVISIAHTQNFDEAEKFKDDIIKMIPGVIVRFVDPLSLSVSCHIGPGALALACCIKNS